MHAKRLQREELSKEQYVRGLDQQDDLLEELVSTRHKLAVRVREKLVEGTEVKTNEIMIGADETSPTERQSERREDSQRSSSQMEQQP